MNIMGQQLLSCLLAFRFGRQAETIESFPSADWQQFYRFSNEHKLVPMVYDSLRNCHDFCKDDPSLRVNWKQSAILQAANQAGRTQRLLELTLALEKAGVCYALLKGALCRQLYAQPDLRPSGDEDLFISKDQRGLCGTVFSKHGLTPVNPREEDSVDHWQDAITGLHIELHTSLFDSGWTSEHILNPWFFNALQHTVWAPVEQTQVRTLQPTAHFLFLLAHALKHFITGGFGARTLCDIVTFAQYYDAQINKETVYQLLEQIYGRIFFDQLLAIGRDYLAFDFQALGWTLSGPVNYSDLLEDMLDAGIYGQTSMDRRHSGALALEVVRSGQQKPSLGSALFPAKERLIGRYPVLKQYPILLPAVWVHRIGAYGLELLRSRGNGNSPGKTVSLGKQRTEMMIKYGIIPQTKTKN